MNITNKNQYEKGITLTALVVTVIVMIILASVNLLTLTNFGILDKTKYAVTQTNLKEVQEYASVGWTKAYIKGAREIEDLTKGVHSELKKHNIDITKYNIEISQSEVKVSLKDFIEDDDNVNSN